MKKILIIASFLLTATLLTAQNEVDALRLSQQFYQGTARSMAMGGAFGALGADFSTLSTNPAGIALYRSSEFSFSPGLFNRSVESTYNNSFADDSRMRFSLGNFGMVFTNEIPQINGKTSPWKFYHYGIGMNRTNHFGSRSAIEGENWEHSLIDIYLDRLDGVDPANINQDNYPFDLYPAWYVYVLDTIRGSDGLLYYDSPIPAGGLLQSEVMSSYGSTNEWLFSAGANLNDRLYIGGTLGLPYTRFYRSTTFTEYNLVWEDVYDFDEWSYTELLETHGWGLNFKLGVIAWPVDWLRLGASIHTPTYYGNLMDVWQTSTEAYIGPDYNKKDSPTGEYMYELSTPLRSTGSAAFIFGNLGLISADVEFVDYSKMRLRANDYSFNNENNSIKNNFQSVVNLRFGTEWRFSNFNFRGGYALYGSPYAEGVNDGALQNISFGVGYSESNFGLDLAWINGSMNQDYFLYSSNNWITNPTQQKIINNHFVLTTRFKF